MMGLELNFTAQHDEWGKVKEVELVPGGAEIEVTDANKLQYVQLLAAHKMTSAIKEQIDAFLEGFYQQVPRELMEVFNEHELELLISGLPTIDGPCAQWWHRGCWLFCCCCHVCAREVLRARCLTLLCVGGAVDDLRRNTTYHGYRPTDEVIRWFWRVLKSFSEEERARFIQFVTGPYKTWLRSILQFLVQFHPLVLCRHG